MPVKNSLASADAQQVEAAFAARLEDGGAEGRSSPVAEHEAAAAAEADQAGGGSETTAPADSKPTGARLPASPTVRRRRGARRLPNGPVIDKSVLALPEPRRLRDREHLKFVARQPCMICGRTPSDSHHLRFAQPRALGRKVSDEFTVPLCRTHHRQLHQIGDERSWWSGNRLDPLATAESLWRRTHPLPRSTLEPEPLAPSGSV
jgi:hypothetical protein